MQNNSLNNNIDNNCSFPTVNGGSKFAHLHVRKRMQIKANYVIGFPICKIKFHLQLPGVATVCPLCKYFLLFSSVIMLSLNAEHVWS